MTYSKLTSKLPKRDRLAAVGFLAIRDGESRTDWMAAAQLWFLAVLARELVADAVEQLQVTLAWVLFERSDECPGHGTRSLAVDLRVRTRLFVLAAGPHDHVGRAGLGLLGLLVRGLAFGRFLEEAHRRRDHAAHVPARVR